MTVIELPRDLDERVRVLQAELRAARRRRRIQRDRTAFAVIRAQLSPYSPAGR